MGRTGRVVAVVVLVVLLCLGGPGLVFASGEAVPSENLLSRTLGKMLQAIAAAVYRLPGFLPLELLVFHQEAGGFSVPEVGGVFYRAEWANVLAWSRRFLAVALLPLLIQVFVVGAGLRMAGAGLSPQRRAELLEVGLNILCALLFAVFGPLLALFVLDVNAALVAAVRSWLSPGGVVAVCAGVGPEAVGVLEVAGSEFLTGAVQLVFAWVWLTLNFLYMIRKFVVALCVVLMPLVAWAWAFRSTRTPVFLVLSELLSNTMMSASHAVVFALLYALFYAVSVPGSVFSTWWARLLAFVLIVPMSQFIRRLFTGWLEILGVDEEKWAGRASMFVGGIVGLGMALGEALGGAGKVAGYGLGWVLRGRGQPGGSGGGDGGGGGSPGQPRAVFGAGVGDSGSPGGFRVVSGDVRGGSSALGAPDVFQAAAGTATRTAVFLPGRPVEVGPSGGGFPPPSSPRGPAAGARRWSFFDVADEAATSFGRALGAGMGFAGGPEQERALGETGAVVFHAPFHAARWVGRVVLKRSAPGSLDGFRW